MRNFDLIVGKIGAFGRFQKINWLVCNLILAKLGVQNLLNVYLQATPEHWCHVPQLANQSVAVQRRITETSSDRNGDDKSCSVNDLNYATAFNDYLGNDTTNSNISSVSCQRWEFDYTLYGTTAVTKWDLVCTKSTFPAISQSLYMLGFLLGAFVFGYLSDRFGRKLSLCASILGSVAFGVISSFLPELWSHVLFRMLSGMCAAGGLAIGFVMGIEPIGIEKRLMPACCTQVMFALGYMLLAGVAYFIRDFVWTNFAMSLLPILVLCYFWILPESPRWLMSKGRVTEAKIVLERAAKQNGVKVDIDQLVDEYTSLESKEEIVEPTNYTIIDLVRTPNMRRKSLIVFYSWFVISMVYYGLTMGVTDLAGDPYLNLFISGICECAAAILMGFILDRFGRKLCLSIVMIIGGVACIVCGLVPADHAYVRIVLSMIGKFGVSGAFAIIYVFTAELMPTVVRTIGVGAGSMSARVGGLMAPFIAELRHFWEPAPTIVFGVLAVSSGLLSLLFPETLGQKLPETLEEGEKFGRNVKLCRWKKSKKRSWTVEVPLN